MRARFLRGPAPLVICLTAVLVLTPAADGEARGNGAIRGRVLNETTGDPQAGVDVTVTSALEDGSTPRTYETRTDGHGRYEITGLVPDDDRFYAVDARWQQGLFAGGVVQIPEGTRRAPVIKTTLRIWDTTSDPTAIVVERDSIFLVPSDEGIGVIEALHVTNTSDKAYIGRGAALDGATEEGGPPGAEEDGQVPSLGFALPEAAELPASPIVDADIDIPSIVGTSFGFAATIAIPPGNRSIAYSYELPGEGGTYELSRPALYPTLEVSVFAADPLRVESNRLEPNGTEQVEARTYDRYTTTEALEPGDELQAIAIADADPGGVLAMAGMAAVLLALAGGGVFLVRRLRPRAPGTQAPPDRAEVIEAIARLDLSKDKGALSEEEWASRRAELRRRLDRIPERTP